MWGGYLTMGWCNLQGYFREIIFLFFLVFAKQHNLRSHKWLQFKVPSVWSEPSKTSSFYFVLWSWNDLQAEFKLETQVSLNGIKCRKIEYSPPAAIASHLNTAALPMHCAMKCSVIFTAAIMIWFDVFVVLSCPSCCYYDPVPARSHL